LQLRFILYSTTTGAFC